MKWYQLSPPAPGSVRSTSASRRRDARSPRPGAWWLCGVAGLALALATWGLPAALQAETFTVNSLADAVDSSLGDGVCEIGPGSGICSLRAAIQEANESGGTTDTILVPGGTFTLELAGQDEDDAATGDLDLTDSVILQGFGPGTTIVDAAGIDRVFDVQSGVTADLSELTIRNGAVDPENGGGVRNRGTLLLTGVAVTGNSAKEAGGIENLLNMTLTDVTLSGNSGSTQGGAVRAEGGTNTLIGVTISGNSANDGAGIFIKGAGTTSGDLTNVTFSGNTAATKGGGIHLEVPVSLTNVTLTGNSSPVGAGINYGGGPAAATLLNTIVANSLSGPDCSTAVTSLGYNIDSDGSCGLAGPGDQPSTDPELGPLQDNGGPSLTHALFAGSPALDTGTNTGCPATDQRGHSRPRNGVCDIGAYEASALYVEAAAAWTVGMPDRNRWVTKDLSGPPFNVPANAVVEIAVRNSDPTLLPAGAGAHLGGLRAPGSALERKILLHQADGGGYTYVTMHVQTNSLSEIEYFAETTDVSFVLLGYWGDGVAYAEEFSSFAVTGAWVDQVLAGVGANEVAELVLTNDANTASPSSNNRGRWAGARANGSSLERRILLDNAARWTILNTWGGGENAATLFVEADASSTVEVYAEDSSITFYVIGSWTTPPGSFQELAETGLGSPSAGYPTWESEDLGPFRLPAFAVAEMLVGHSDDDDAPLLGVRSPGSSLDRTVQPHDGGLGSNPPMACCEDDTQLARMHVATDAASAIEWSSQSSLDADDHFFLSGFWFDLLMDGDFSEWDDGVGTEICVDDQGGADDWTSPTTLDITKFCIASDLNDDIVLLFGFDDVTLSGGNEATSCVLVDTDDPPNDTADRLICTTLAGPGATQVDAVELFVCDDSMVDGCGGAVLTKTYTAADYGFSNTVTGPFGGSDSFVEVMVPYSDLGVAGGSIVFSSMISYPGNSPQNLTAPKDSIFGFSGIQDYATRITYNLDSGSGATVPVTLAFFRATGGGGAVLFEWATASEVGHLGFHLYEVGEDRLRRLTERLIASPGGDSLGPRHYRHRSSGVRGELYVLEARDIFGGSQYHGPFALGASYGREELPDQRLAWGEIRARSELARREGVLARRGPATRPGGDRPPAARLLVDRDGIQRVTHAELLAAGVDLTGVPAGSLALLEGGRPVPLRVGGSWIFGPGSFVEFVGRAVESLYTRTNVYTLLVDPRQALPMPSGDARSDTLGVPPTFYLESRRVESNRDYHFAAPGGDPWYDTRLLAISGPVEASFDLELEGWLEGAAPVVLDVALWGVTDFPQSPDHHVVLAVNDTEVADEWFDGLASHPVTVDLPDWLLAPTGNSLRVALPHDTGAAYDLVHYDHYRLTYPRRFVAREGRLSFTAAAGRFRVEGLPSSALVVYRIGESGPEWVRNLEVRGLPGAYSVAFPGSKAAATYYVSILEALRRPQVEPAPVVPDLLDRPAELLILAHRDFLAGIEPLATARRSEGLSVRVVDIDDVYTRFSHGVVDPEAIRAYLRSAYKGLETRYVLLVGGDTYDYLDYLGLGSISFIPTLYAQTHPIVRFAPVDPLLADLDGDAVPDLAIGRLPVRTVDELQAVVEKTLEYGDAGYAQSAVMAADAFDVGSGTSFSAGSDEMLSRLPPSWPAERAYIDDRGVAGAHDVLIQQINAGVGLTNYLGHSGLGVWSFHRLFDLADAAELENSGRPTVVTQWGCWNTYYVSPIYETLAEGLLLAADRGAAAVLGNTALTETTSELELGRRLFAQLALPGQTLGDSLQAAKQDLAAAHPELIDVLLGFTLLGDPTLVLQP